MKSSLRRLVAGLAGLPALLLAACGPNYLTPEQVRQHLESPKGQVSADTIGRATDDFFQAQRGSSAEGMATFIKTSESSGDGAAAWANDVIVSGAMEDAVALGAVEDIGDLFCAASLVASIASFDSCSSGSDNCEAELVIDACVLRIGENGDRAARGKIRFKVKQEVNDEFERDNLEIHFEDWEFTDDEESGITSYMAGIIAIEATEWPSREELIFSCDLDSELRGPERGLFNDDIRERARVTVALRFTATESETSEAGSLELLAFVDETDDSRDESVVLSFSAESHRVDDSTTLAGATLSVRGSNGAFDCTWSTATEEIEGEVRSYNSDGVCIDAETGEEFTWDATTTYGES